MNLPDGTDAKADESRQRLGANSSSPARASPCRGGRSTLRSGTESIRHPVAPGPRMIGPADQTGLRRVAAKPTVVGNALPGTTSELNLDGRLTDATAFRLAEEPSGARAGRDGGVRGGSRPTAQSFAGADVNPKGAQAQLLPARNWTRHLHTVLFAGSCGNRPPKPWRGTQAQGSIGPRSGGNAFSRQRTWPWSKALRSGLN